MSVPDHLSLASDTTPVLSEAGWDALPLTNGTTTENTSKHQPYRALRIQKPTPSSCYCITVLENLGLIAVGGALNKQKGVVFLYDYKHQHKLVAIRQTHETQTVKMRYIPEFKWLITTGYDKTVRLLDLKCSLRQRKTLTSNFDGMIFVEYNINRNLFITGDYTNIVQIFELDTFKKIDEIVLDTVWVCHVQYFEQKDIIFMYSSVDEIKFYNWPSKTLYGRFQLMDRCNSLTLLQMPNQVIIPNDSGDMVFLEFNETFLSWTETSRRRYAGYDAFYAAGKDNMKYLLLTFTRGKNQYAVKVMDRTTMVENLQGDIYIDSETILRCYNLSEKMFVVGDDKGISIYGIKETPPMAHD